MPGLARPVRMPAKSSLATSTAFSIFSSASRRVSSIIVGLLPSHSVGVGRSVSAVGRGSAAHPGVTSVPILSPRSARATLPSPSMPKTTMGSLLSMQRLNAAASTTRSPCCSASA